MLLISRIMPWKCQMKRLSFLYARTCSMVRPNLDDANCNWRSILMLRLLYFFSHTPGIPMDLVSQGPIFLGHLVKLLLPLIRLHTVSLCCYRYSSDIIINQFSVKVHHYFSVFSTFLLSRAPEGTYTITYFREKRPSSGPE